MSREEVAGVCSLTSDKGHLSLVQPALLGKWGEVRRHGCWDPRRKLPASSMSSWPKAGHRAVRGGLLGVLGKKESERPLFLLDMVTTGGNLWKEQTAA